VHGSCARLPGSCPGAGSRRKGDRGGLVRVCGTEGFAADFLPRALADFQARRRDVSFELRLVLPAAEVARSVREGDADIGMTFSRIAEKGIAVAHRQAAPVMALMRAGHPLAGARSVSLARLQEYPLALPSADNTLRQLIELASVAKRLSLPPAFTSDFAQALYAFVLQGDGVTFSAEVSARPFVARGDAVLVPLSDRVMAERHLEIQTLAGRALPGFMTDVLATLQARLSAGDAIRSSNRNRV
jgi:DNA-binding transcriptional LysR family regulator